MRTAEKNKNFRKEVKIMNTRKPTQEEQTQLLEYLQAKGYGDLRDQIEKWYMAVFDNYQTDYPGYTGRLLVIVATHDPFVTEVYIWTEGKIQRVTEEWVNNLKR